MEAAAWGLKDRSTPEYDAKRAKLAAQMQYRHASRLLRELLPVSGGSTHSTVRKHARTTGQRFAAELRRAQQTGRSCMPPAASLTLGLDTGFVRALSCEGERHHSVVVGQLERPDGTHRHFATVRKTGKAQEEIRSRLHQMGYHSKTKVTVLTDGEEGLGVLACRALGKPIVPILDWFHIAMPLRSIRQNAKSLNARGAVHAETAKRIQDELEHLHWRLWHGKTHVIGDSFDDIRANLRKYGRRLRERREASVARKISFDLCRFDRYVRSKSARIVNYARSQQQGEPVSTSVVESTVQNLLNRRMDNKQQMQWSAGGANDLLQVRAAVLNGEFDALWQQATQVADEQKEERQLLAAA